MQNLASPSLGLNPQSAIPNPRFPLNRRLSLLVSADADDVLDGGNKNLAVADLSGLGRTENGLERVGQQRIPQHDFDFDLGQEIHRVFAAPVNLRMSFLPAKTLDLADGHAVNADAAQGVLDLVQFERLDDRFNFFHACGGANRTPRVRLQSTGNAIARNFRWISFARRRDSSCARPHRHNSAVKAALADRRARPSACRFLCKPAVFYQTQHEGPFNLPCAPSAIWRECNGDWPGAPPAPAAPLHPKSPHKPRPAAPPQTPS